MKVAYNRYNYIIIWSIGTGIIPFLVFEWIVAEFLFLYRVLFQIDRTGTARDTIFTRYLLTTSLLVPKA